MAGRTSANCALGVRYLRALNGILYFVNLSDTVRESSSAFYGPYLPEKNERFSSMRHSVALTSAPSISFGLSVVLPFCFFYVDLNVGLGPDRDFRRDTVACILASSSNFWQGCFDLSESEPSHLHWHYY
jgi:hypothetical protein